jgi:poly(hydroxyalkanoate) depolymerase family esterase
VPLGEVLRTLSEGRTRLGLEGERPGLQMPRRVPDLSLPEGAAFHNRHHACAAGARRYRRYVPAFAGEGLQGLVVMLHGCTQNPEDFAAGTGMNAIAEEHRLLVAYPAQTHGDNKMACWNWFRPSDQMRGRGEPAIIAGLTESLRDEFGIPRDRVFVAGLSVGGAMAAIMAETYPDLYAAVGIHSGLAYGSANDVMSAFSAMKGQSAVQRPAAATEAVAGEPRVIVLHGSADATVHPSNADRIVAGLRRAPARMERSEHPGVGACRGHIRTVARRADGAVAYETWIVDGAPHAWFGGSTKGSYTDPNGANASVEMVRFFLKPEA